MVNVLVLVGPRPIFERTLVVFDHFWEFWASSLVVKLVPTLLPSWFIPYFISYLSHLRENAKRERLN
jgi:hypothetical protein